MTRKEAIKWFKKSPFYHKGHEPFNMAIHALDQDTRWIPVSEMLPEKNVEVLATTEWGVVTIAERYSVDDWFIHEGNVNSETDEIAAWMPLPKPYNYTAKSALDVAQEIVKNGGIVDL